MMDSGLEVSKTACNE